jgi:zinc and cadmium transporter
MNSIVLIFFSLFIISLISLIGIFTISVRTEKLKKFLIYFVALSAGTLLGGAFLHLIPESTEEIASATTIGLFVLSGICFSFVLEKIVCWRHCHHPTTKEHPHPLTTMNLFGDGVHNFIDGIIIAASYLINIPLGIITTLAVALHEIPQEMGNFGVLIYGGYTKKRALIFNFIISLTSFIGAVLTILFFEISESILIILIPFAAGNFIYIATADLIPELNKRSGIKTSVIQLIMFLIGISLMFLFLLFE